MNTDTPLQRQAFGLLAALAVQYLLGMAINMYIQFPDSLSENQLWEFSRGQPLVVAHIILAFLLLFGSIALVVRAQKMQSAAWKLPAWLGFLAILASGFAGSRFIPTQSDPYSYLMAATFLLAFIAYCWGLYRAK